MDFSRKNKDAIDPNVVYAGDPTMFSIELHHGGKFSKFPNIDYIGGEVVYLDYVDIDLFSSHELDSVMKELGYDGVAKVIYYHFRLPNEGFDFGLRALGNDADVQFLSQFVADNKLIRIYTEHGETNLLTYFMSPVVPNRRVIIQQLEDEEHPNQSEPAHEPARYESLQSKLNISKGLNIGKERPSCSKKLCLEWIEETPYKPEIQKEDPLTDKYNMGDVMAEEILGFDPFEGLEGVEPRGEKEVQMEMGIDEEEFESDSNEDVDEDFLVDEENEIPDVDVDMDNFYMSIDTEVEYVGQHNRKCVDNDDDQQEDGVEVINNDEWDSLSDDSENNSNRRALLKTLTKETECSMGEVHKVDFVVGQKYKTKKELKQRIEMHALQTKRNITFKKNDKIRLTATCDGNVGLFNSKVVGATVSSQKGKGQKEKGKKNGKGKESNDSGVTCTWRLHASQSSDEDYWYVKTYNHTHTCSQTRKIRYCTATFLSKQMVDQMETNPSVPVRSLLEHYRKKYDVSISEDKISRAKATALELVNGDYTRQYAVLRDYVLELQATNPDTTVKIEVVSEPNYTSTTRQFMRIYVCLGALKKGFKAGMREFLGLDGAFMKGPFPGQVLTAVGVDPNNGIYPVAYAIVEAEKKTSWKWFLECLGDDLDLQSKSNFTWISDRQKGLIPAIAEVYPCAEHRYCLRHIHQNMRMKWRTNEYKERLWNCATATTLPEFEALMEEFRTYDKDAYAWLLKIPPQHWARSHFSGRAKSDMLLNNVCEVFNSKLIHGRDKPIISCLEYIRQYLMKRICNVTKVIDKCTGPLTPFATKILDDNISKASQYTAKWNGLHKYQVHGPWHDQHVVDMRQLTCSCRKWELSGIPCKHAVAALNEKEDSGEVVGEIHTYVNKVYWVETWRTMYSFKVDPIKGRAMWPKSAVPFTLVPPPHQVLPGRPQKKRRLTADERSDGKKGKSQRQAESQTHSQSQTQKLPRNYLPVTCSKCKQKGHNARTCKGGGGNGV